MIYPLQLHPPIGSFTQPDDIRKQVKERLESIKGFEKRLSWYNDHVRSLATYESEGAEVYYEWGNPDQKLKVFCNCNSCRSEADFDTNQEVIYRKVRAKEIERLKKGINNAASYKD